MSRQHFETTPLVFDGVMYITDPPSDVTALDLRTGRPIWHYQIFINTIDAHLVALDARMGRVRWDVEVADWKLTYTMTAAPLAIKDKIIERQAAVAVSDRGRNLVESDHVPVRGTAVCQCRCRQQSDCVRSGSAGSKADGQIARGAIKLMEQRRDKPFLSNPVTASQTQFSGDE